MSSVDELPIGTVTFLFTDIEGSTQLLKQLGGDRYGGALADHQRILREAFAEHGGHEIDTQGDSFGASSPSGFEASRGAGRYMASILELLDLRASVRVVPLDPATGVTTTSTRSATPALKAQIGLRRLGEPTIRRRPASSRRSSAAPRSSRSLLQNANLARFCDPSIDAKMERASSLQTQDPPAATLLWQQIERSSLAQAPVVPTTNRRDVDFLSEARRQLPVQPAVGRPAQPALGEVDSGAPARSQPPSAAARFSATSAL